MQLRERVDDLWLKLHSRVEGHSYKRFYMLAAFDPLYDRAEAFVGGYNNDLHVRIQTRIASKHASHQGAQRD